MAIRFLQKIVSRISGNLDNGLVVASKSANGRGSKRRTRPASSLKKEESKTVETWRPGQETTAGTTAKSTNLAASRPVRKKRLRRKKNDGSVLSQPGGGEDVAVVKPESNVQQPNPNAQSPQVKKQERLGKNEEPAAKDRRPETGAPRPKTKKAQRSATSDPKRPETQKEWSLDDYKIEPEEDKTRFHDVDLPLDIMHAISDLGFKFCTPIQARVLKEVAEGNNVAGKAQTGTGKTAAFLLLTFKQFWNNPLPRGDRKCGRPRALVIAPTRELVAQIVKDAQAIGKYTPIRSVAIYGGTGYEQQERELLKSPVDLIAATPGRLLDFQNKRKIDLSGVEVLVIDEADRMLDMGFIPDVRKIIRHTPPKDQRRTLLFSATLTESVMTLASQWMPDPKMIEIEPDHVAVDTVKQLVYMVRAQEKFTILYNLLKRPNIGRVLIFANRRDQTERIAGELHRYNVPCEILSGAVNQNRRERVLEDFRSGKIQTVVATDVAGRGLHVDDINHVVNFDLPYEAEDYVHRIGRTGRAGAEGTAVSFACEDESFTIPEIEEYIGEDMSCKYPEEILLKALPPTNAKPYQKKRPPQNRDRNFRSGGNRGSGSRPPRRR